MAGDLYRDPAVVRSLVGQVREAASCLEDRVTIMEVCGTHTHTIARAGLRKLMPESVRLISGPGCPVCVTPVGYLDRAGALLDLGGISVCTFGDLVRVPSSGGTLEQVRAEGRSVHIVYSPRDALERARSEPSATVEVLAIGFETTVPTIAAMLEEAESTGVDNVMIVSGHKVMPPPLRALAGDDEVAVDGFLLPGHVSVVTGSNAFQFLAKEFGLPGAVVGFTPADVLRGVLEIIRQVGEGRPEVSNLYGRVVTPDGNRTARQLVDRYFEATDAAWRGLGTIPGSGLTLRRGFEHRDAARLEVVLPEPKEPAGCRCGEVLRGLIDPPECPLFGAGCDPDSAVGACMVSSEGACAAWYRHERLDGGAER